MLQQLEPEQQQKATKSVYILELDIYSMYRENHIFPCCFVFFSGSATPLAAKQMVSKSKEYESGKQQWESESGSFH